MTIEGRNVYLYDVKLQARLEQVVGKIGKGATIAILDALSQFGDENRQPMERARALVTYIIRQTALTYQLDPDKFLISSLPEYRDARMVSVYLARKYSPLSRKNLCGQFHLNERQLRYCEDRMREINSIPQFHKTFLQPVEVLDQTIKEFLNHIKQSH